jgi:hypothetical protein
MGGFVSEFCKSVLLYLFITSSVVRDPAQVANAMK